MDDSYRGIVRKLIYLSKSSTTAHQYSSRTRLKTLQFIPLSRINIAPAKINRLSNCMFLLINHAICLLLGNKNLILHCTAKRPNMHLVNQFAQQHFLPFLSSKHLDKPGFDERIEPDNLCPSTFSSLFNTVEPPHNSFLPGQIRQGDDYLTVIFKIDMWDGRPGKTLAKMQGSNKMK